MTFCADDLDESNSRQIKKHRKVATINVEDVEGETGYWVTCPCGEEMRFGFAEPERAVAQANRIDEYAGRVGECHHGKSMPRAEQFDV